MGAINKKIDAVSEKLWFSMVISGIFLLFYVFFYYPVWGTNDDVGMLAFFVGAKGVRDPHALYINILLGKVFCRLYGMVPDFPWYPLAQYAVIYCSVTLVCHVLIKRLGRERLWLVIIFAAAFSYEGYIRIQFTKTAGIACAAGGLLLVYALSRRKVAIAYYLIGLALMMIGSMYRYNQFQCELALFFGLAFYLFLSLVFSPAKGKIVSLTDRRDDLDGMSSKKERMGRLVFCIFTALLVLGMGTGLRQIHKMGYSSKEWQEFQAYNLARATLLDYGMPDYDEYEEEYNALGIDRTAYRLFNKWTHADSEKITTEVMQKILAMQKPKDVISKKFVKGYIKTILPGIPKIMTFWLFAAFAVVWLIDGKKRPKECICLLCQAGIVLILYFYFFYLGRYLLNRVDVGIWMIMSMTVLWMIGSSKTRFPGSLRVILMLIGIFAVSYSARNMLRVNQKAKMQSFEERKAVVEAIHADSDHIYLTKTNTITLAKAYNVWDNIPFGIFTNQHYLGGWASNTPVAQEVLKKWGINNPMRDMIDNDKVYLIDKDIELTERYLRIWYDEKAAAVRIKNKKLSPYKVWQIRTDKDE